MKRIDKYSKEQIAEMITDLKCWHCAYSDNGLCLLSNANCYEGVQTWFNTEIKTVPRIQTINTVEELREATNFINKYCLENDCMKCKYQQTNVDDIDIGFESLGLCFANYLAEEVEVEG